MQNQAASHGVPSLEFVAKSSVHSREIRFWEAPELRKGEPPHQLLILYVFQGSFMRVQGPPRRSL